MKRKSYDLPAFEWEAGRALIELRDVRKIFKTAIGEVAVLKGIQVDLMPGEFVSVVGRSGSGKSTLANMITGIDHPSGGTVQVAGTLLNHMPESRMAVWRGHNLGIVFQFFQLMPMLTLLENVMLPMDLANLYAPAARETRARRLLARVGLEAFAHKLPGAVSGGQQQGAAIARALANDPPVLIADEPTGNLDSRSAENVMLLFEELVGQHKTILMVTHDPLLARRTQRSLIISDGELVPEVISRAFPDLPHGQMLQLGQQARRQTFAPRSSLPQSVVADGLSAVIAHGQALLYPHGVKNSHPGEPRILEAGTVFNRIDLRRDFGTGAEVFSGEQPLEVWLVERAAAEVQKVATGSVRPEKRSQ